MGLGFCNMVHSESSLSNGSSSYNPKFKRRKVYAVRDFPPGCGTLAMRNPKPLNVILPASTTEAGCEDSSTTQNMVTDLVVYNHEQSLPLDQSLPKSILIDDESLIVQNSNHVGSRKMAKKRVALHGEGSGTNKCEIVSLEEITDLVVYNDEQSLPLDQSLPKSILIDEPLIVQNSNRVGSRKMAKKRVALHGEGSGTNKCESEEITDLVVYNDEQSLPRDCLDQSFPKSILTNDASEPLLLKNSSRVRSRKMARKRVGQRESGEGSGTNKCERNQIARQPQTLQVGIPPSRPNGSSSGDGIRNKVKETLRLFHGACRKILQEQEATKSKGDRKLRVDFEAAKLLKAKGLYLNAGKQILGPVPGVEVGDEYQYRMELNILGIHRPSQGGIDYMKDTDDEIIATSIVSSGGYDDELDNSDVLTYTGQGGNVIKVSKKGKEKKEPQDQQLITGNLALANSKDKQNAVRVIRGKKNAALESSSDAKGSTYVYDGLYVVEEYWQEIGSHGKLVYKFKLRRKSGQPELSWKVVKKSKKLKYREGLCKLDISEGKERLPISAVNEIDDEKPPMFTYTVKMIYPDWCRPIPPKACGCTTRCTEARKCSCVTKNGGEIPYNYDGAIVGAKTLIYECGPLCKCPTSCYLRVTQRGIKFQLEIFKTASRGWGVRSLNSIPSGSFICEYVGELLEDKEAERRTGNDEYLFDIGNKYDNSLAEGMSNLMSGTGAGPAMKEEEEDDETSGFTIDAAKKGNIGRFINHSCSPNLYAQNVLYDHEDTRIPHVMFFAMDNIPPLQELSYHYNYVIDQVRDANGNIKKKICYCGSSECSGRLY